MKKIILKLSIIPALLLAGFIALQSFQEKQSVHHQFTSPEWFIFTGTTETQASEYDLAPSNYDPDQEGCDGYSAMCAVLALNDGNGKPILDVSGATVVTGSNVSEIRRHP